MKKLIIILLVVILAGSLLRAPFESVVIKEPEEEESEEGSGGGSGSGSPTVTASWHEYGDCVETCSSARYYCDNDGYLSDDQVDHSNGYIEGYGFGSYNQVTCSLCNSNATKSITHCFIDGVCHGCGEKCAHYPSGMDAYNRTVLPENHPLREFGVNPEDTYMYTLTMYNTYIDNGICQLCRMPQS